MDGCCMGNGREKYSIGRGLGPFSWRFDGNCGGCIAGIWMFVEIIV